MVLKVPMMYLQKLKVLILVAWPNCCLNDCIVNFPLPLLQLHLALKLIPNTNNCVILLSFLALLCFALLCCAPCVQGVQLHFKQYSGLDL